MKLEYEVGRNRFRVSPKCPCGKSNRDGKFSPIKGYKDKGKCHSCGKFFSPDEKKRVTFNFPYNLIGIECNLFRYLSQLYGYERVKQVFNLYKMASKDNSTIYPYINRNNDIVTAKVIRYNDDGKRDKTKPPYYMHPKDYELNMCLFGEHLIQPGQPVNVCESEKSALIATIVLGGIWVATGGKSNIKLIDRIGNVKILYPDNDAIDDWKDYGNINYKYINYVNSMPSGYDVGDYCLDISKKNKIVINLSNFIFLPKKMKELNNYFDLELISCNDDNYINICKQLHFLSQLLEKKEVINYYENGKIRIHDVKAWVNDHYNLIDWYLTEYRDLHSESYNLLNELSEFYCKKYKDSIEIL